MAGSVMAAYKVTDPHGKTFTALVLGPAGANKVISNRGGENNWREDPHLTIADLAFPEQTLHEWTVEEMDNDPDHLNPRR